MNIRLCLFIVGTFLIFLGLLLAVPVVVSFIYKDGKHFAFITTAIITSVCGFILKEVNKKAKDITELERKEAFLVAFLCWFVACIFGSLPYLLVPIFSHPVDALFEAVAGFTTTGSSVINDLTIMPHSILFYRSYTQWLGGMGIIVLALAILPRLSVGGMQLMGLEAPGPVTEKLTPKIAETAKALWIVYIGLSLLLMLILYLCKMPIFDSVVTSFSTLSTGGFSVKNASIGEYNSALIEYVITVFMFLAGMNFLLYYFAITGRISSILKDTELRFYAFLVLSFIAVISIDLWYNNYHDIGDSIRYASFQVISILTTTGFSSTDFGPWPLYSIFLLLSLMFIGACAGSTSGSIKVVRILILIKKSYREINHLIKPRAIIPVRINDKVLSDDIISSVTSFFLLYILIFVFSTGLILTFEDISVLGALSAVAASLGNVGPGFEEHGPTHTYNFLSSYSKAWLSLLMIVGRLELYTVLVIFSPLFWKK